MPGSTTYQPTPDESRFPDGEDDSVCVIVVVELSGGGDRGVGALGSVVCEQDRHGWFLAPEASGARSAS